MQAAGPLTTGLEKPKYLFQYVCSAGIHLFFYLNLPALFVNQITDDHR